MHGDRVEISWLPQTDPERPAGEVVRIIDRGRSHLVGLLVKEGGGLRDPWRLRPFDRRIPLEILVPERFLHGAEEGDFVEATLLRDSREGQQDRGPLRARVRGVLGRMDEPGTDVRVVLSSYGLADDHPPESVAEAERMAARQLDADELARREDMRELVTVTIDGETARDFDDAVSIERRGEGYRLWVHVADVADFVREGSPLDAEAYARGTSVYLPDRAIHMLPEVLSAGACSLRPDEDRRAMTAILDFDAEGLLQSSRFAEALIRSNRRMTYTQIKRLLVDRDEELRAEHGDLLPDFELMGDLAEKLIARREERGGLDFDLPVPILQLDEDGLPIDVTPSERNLAHRLIEEFMIAANSAVAKRLTDTEEPALHRNHEPPPPDKVSMFAEAAAVFGHELKTGTGETPHPLEFEAVLEAAQGRPEEQLLTSMALRSMSMAVYEPEAKGHFGLALDHYCHFTSPIRRYPDLIVHRALKALLREETTPPEERSDSLAELSEDGEHLSSRERNAEEAERALRSWKTCRFMAERIGETYDARISGLASQGLYVLLDYHRIDGFVHFRDLKRDWYERDEQGFRIVGRDTGRILRPGDALRVTVASVDVLGRQINFDEARGRR
jgi:ribonuclease R